MSIFVEWVIGFWLLIFSIRNLLIQQTCYEHLYYKRRYTEIIVVLNKAQGLKLLWPNIETTLNEEMLNNDLLHIYINVNNMPSSSQK